MTTDNDYVPTTGSVRNVFARALDWRRRVLPVYAGWFDRWLAEHDAQIVADEQMRITRLAEEFDWRGWTDPASVFARSIVRK